MPNTTISKNTSKNNTSLERFTSIDATSVGGSLPLAILSNITADAAVDEWMLTYPALMALDKEYFIVRQFFNQIGKCLLKKSNLFPRLVVGAMLSVLDMVR